MEYGITTSSCVPQRQEPSHRSEMCSQLLFGEIFEVLDRDGKWQRVRNETDGYEGWVDSGGVKRFDASRKALYSGLSSCIQSPLYLELNPQGRDYTIRTPAGSLLHYDPAEPGIILCEEPHSVDQPCEPIPPANTAQISSLAISFLGIPYLWGGRSSYGCDCSGFVQTLTRIFGVRMPRDARQQVSRGKAIHLIDETSAGDLAFFDDEEGQIHHVGMILEPGKIIHASGMVRVDQLDHQGIFNATLQQYTHRLRVIKRIFNPNKDDHR